MNPYREIRRYVGNNDQTVEQIRRRLDVGSGKKRIRKDFVSYADASEYAVAIKKLKRNLRERRDELCRLADLPWIQGVGRRSFATLFYQHTGDDVLTRSILGHLGDAKIFIASYRAADVIENGFRRRVTNSDAETYFGIPIENHKEIPTVA